MMKVVFILGSGHSGSTLLDLLLDSHSKILGVGELVSQDYDPTNDTFWRDVIPSGRLFDITRSKKDFFLGRKQYRYTKSGDVVDKGEYRGRIISLLQSAAAKKGARVIVDSSKNPDYMELLATSSTIDPMMIHIVRDGRGVFASYLRKYPEQFWFSCTRWFLMNLKVELLRRRLRVPYLYVRYEELVAHPQRVLEKILRQAELTFEPAMLNFRAVPHHQISGNRMKREETNEIRIDESWRHTLTLGQKFLFNLLFGWLNLLYRSRKSL